MIIMIHTSCELDLELLVFPLDFWIRVHSHIRKYCWRQSRKWIRRMKEYLIDRGLKNVIAASFTASLAL